LVAEHPVDFTINSFSNYKEASAYLIDAENKTIPTFVFLEYFGGNGISGSHLLKILNEQYAHAEVIFISQGKDSMADSFEQIDTKRVYDYVIKDDYTPTLCRLLLEKYIEKYS